MTNDVGSIYCIECAALQGTLGAYATGQVRTATGALAGNSVCPKHGGVHCDAVDLPALCAQCAPTARKAWLALEGIPLCVRHAAFAWFPEDDMGAHDMAHALYLQMHADGIRDAY